LDENSRRKKFRDLYGVKPDVFTHQNNIQMSPLGFVQDEKYIEAEYIKKTNAGTVIELGKTRMCNLHISQFYNHLTRRFSDVKIFYRNELIPLNTEIENDINSNFFVLVATK